MEISIDDLTCESIALGAAPDKWRRKTAEKQEDPVQKKEFYLQLTQDAFLLMILGGSQAPRCSSSRRKSASGTGGLAAQRA